MYSTLVHAINAPFYRLEIKDISSKKYLGFLVDLAACTSLLISQLVTKVLDTVSDVERLQKVSTERENLPQKHNNELNQLPRNCTSVSSNSLRHSYRMCFTMSYFTARGKKPVKTNFTKCALK